MQEPGVCQKDFFLFFFFLFFLVNQLRINEQFWRLSQDSVIFWYDQTQEQIKLGCRKLFMVIRRDKPGKTVLVKLQ